MVAQNHQIISSHELHKNGGSISAVWLSNAVMKKYNLIVFIDFLIFHAMDDSNELAQAITGNFMMLLCKDGEVSAPNLRTY